MRTFSAISKLLIVAAVSGFVGPQSALAEEAAEPAAGDAAAGGEDTFGDPEPATQSLDELLAGLRDPDAANRVAAVRALSERREAAAVGPLVRLLRSDPVPEVRGWAVRALHELGTDEAHAAVRAAATDDPDERVRSMAGRLENVAPARPQPFAPEPPRVQVPQVVPAYQGYQVPPQPVRIPGRGLRIGGIITTSVTYGLALIVGASLLSTEDTEWEDRSTERDYGWKLMLPVVGPAVAATTNDAGEASVIFWIWSAAQVAGITLLAVGYARRARFLREQEAEGSDEDPEPEAHRRGFGLAVLPGPGGLSVSGWF